MSKTIECLTCQGNGRYQVGPTNMYDRSAISPEYEEVVCENCEGSGSLPVRDAIDFIEAGLRILGGDLPYLESLVMASIGCRSGLKITRSIDDARSYIKEAFPGWTYRVAECSVSDDAWLIPDFNDPNHGAELQKRFPDALRDPVEWFATDIDLRPAGRPAIAMCLAMLAARRRILEVESE